MNSTFRYAVLSAVLAAGPAMADDYRALGSLSSAALDEAQLARIEGGQVCTAVFSSAFQAICQSQIAAITQANVAVSGNNNNQNNSAYISQNQNATQIAY